MDVALTSVFKLVANQGGDPFDRAVGEDDHAIGADAVVAVHLLKQLMDLLRLPVGVDLHAPVQVAGAVAVARLAVEGVEQGYGRVDLGVLERGQPDILDLSRELSLARVHAATIGTACDSASNAATAVGGTAAPRARDPRPEESRAPRRPADSCVLWRVP